MRGICWKTGGNDDDGVTHGFDYSLDAEPCCLNRRFHLTTAAKALFLKPVTAHGSITECQATKGQTGNEVSKSENAARKESEAEATGPTGGKRSEAAGPSHHGEGDHRENENGPSPEIRPKKITSTKLGAYLFDKILG